MNRFQFLFLGFALSATAQVSPSVEKLQVEAAKTQALLEGKKVYLRVSAAWCGPCANLDQEMEEQREVLAPTLSQYVMVDVEEMHLERYGVSDFMPIEIPWYPSVFTLDPVSDTWAFMPFDTAMDLKNNLDLFIADPTHFSARTTEQFLAKLDRGEAPTYSYQFDEILMTSSLEPSRETLFATMAALDSRVLANPALIGGQENRAVFEDSLRGGLIRLMEKGVLSQGDALSLYPALFPFDDMTLWAGDFFFSAPLHAKLRLEGIAATTDACESHMQNHLAQISGRLSEERQRAAAQYDRLTCAFLNASQQRINGDGITALFSGLNETSRRNYAGIISLFYALTGQNFAEAIEHAMIQRQANEDNAERPERMKSRIRNAIDARIAALRVGRSHP